MKFKTTKELKDFIYSVPIPSNWRQGQFVFNRVETVFGPQISRTVQFEDGVDCFYVDEYIDEFINKVFDRLNN